MLAFLGFIIAVVVIAWTIIGIFCLICAPFFAIKKKINNLGQPADWNEQPRAHWVAQKMGSV